MKRILLMVAMVLSVALCTPVGTGTRAQQRQQLGGRPGEFHFILKDQADQNRLEFRDAQLRIERMRMDILATASNDESRRRMLNDLDGLQLFVSSMQTQLTSPVGQTARDVEQRLNGAKGQSNCETCHEGAGIRASK